MKLDDIGRDPPEVDALEAGAPRPILDLCNAQQGTEGAENGLRLRDRLIDSVRVLLTRSGPPPRPLEPTQKAGERRTQVMCDIVRDALRLAHEALDVVQHPVAEVHETVQVTGAPPGRQTLL